ncbi:MAG: hypothetical protein GX874_10810 [Smithella sp.]|nr:hypothetical protein [Smithella sp.]
MSNFMGWLWKLICPYAIIGVWALIIHFIAEKPYGYWSKKANESLWYLIMILIGTALLVFAALLTIFYVLLLWGWIH